ncbi:trypsin-like serine protease [Amycolatopsis aidingensis]|uniref:trypsin-like serine protease n=1 Tax=Amycolatopsis aidingensis TaxID=2842453 RepID=UPI001E5AD813|nr:trypsin-like serine protease [Amycolatopsis aidingensis]
MRLRKIGLGAGVLLASAGLMLGTAQAATAAPESTPDTAPVAASAEGGGDVSPYIVGGRRASQTYEFMASLQSSGRHFCGGSLIRSNWVVTAKHCIQSQSPGRFQVRVGSTRYDSGGTLVGTSRIVPGSGDIALVQLSQSVSQTPIDIADAGTSAGTETRLIGFGQTCATRGGCGASRDLMEIDVTVQASGCTANFDPNTELCLGGVPRAGACYGDSGGPSVVREGGEWRLTGATSRAGRGQPTCGQAPAIYMKVPAYRSWINGVVGDDDDDDPPPQGCEGVPAWQAGGSYQIGDVVAHNGHRWEAIWYPGGAEPGDPTSWAVWEDLGPC